MKFVIVAVFMALAVAETFATMAVPVITPVEQTAVSMEENLRAKKSTYGAAAPSYGGSSYSAPPCPKNYLFSCQPAVKPVGCSQSYGASYGSAGAYTENRPQYILPQYNQLPYAYGTQRF
ncbi:hypothetical protein ACFFRR_002596 [Megaselia abdita]